MSRVTKRPEAEADLLEIAVYIAQDDLAASDRFIDAVAEKLDLLARHPTMGRLRSELAPDLRSFPMGQYVVFYRATGILGTVFDEVIIRRSRASG